MKFLFFDIECSNGHDICSFGYCLTDQKFKLLKKEDVVINPESKIILSKKGQPAKMQLAYSQEYFNKQNPFSFYYPKIVSLLTNKKYIIFGHALQSDFSYLNIACKRYNLPTIAIQGYDMQKLHHILYRTQHIESLEKIVEELDIEKSFLYHKSSEDAHATMLVTRQIFEENDLNIDKLKELYPECLIINNIKDKKETKDENLRLHEEGE